MGAGKPSPTLTLWGHLRTPAPSADSEVESSSAQTLSAPWNGLVKSSSWFRGTLLQLALDPGTGIHESPDHTSERRLPLHVLTQVLTKTQLLINSEQIQRSASSAAGKCTSSLPCCCCYLREGCEILAVGLVFCPSWLAQTPCSV